MRTRRWAASLLLALLFSLTPAAMAQADSPPPPRDPASGKPTARVLVSSGGMQLIDAAALSAAGLNPADANRLQLWHAGTPVALEQRGSGTSLSLRFYAPAPGNRWNSSATYWLRREDGPGLRMASRSVTPDTAPARATALERGTWRSPAVYDSTTPGPEGEHWFAASLSAGPDLNLNPRLNWSTAALEAQLGPHLPAASGPMTVTLLGSAITSGAHLLDIQLGAAVQRLSWTGRGNFTRTVVFSQSADIVRLEPVESSAPDAMLILGIEWERQARLDFNGAGAAFHGLAGSTRYTLDRLPAGASLYAIDDPARPELLTGLNAGFEDQGTHAYLLVGNADLQRPDLRAFSGLNLPTPATALYIAPASLHAALAPLVTHRRAQGHSVALVDLQTLYDGWSDGQVEPEAIRSFLRYAAATWSTPPLGVTLVGDGTSDPHDWTGRGANNLNLVPPYLAPVDPWLGETACETCYGQLDGASALADEEQDLAVGRLPVKSASELTAVVAKILAYEQASNALDQLAWRSQAILLADNGYQTDGTADPAGDFARYSDAALALLPINVHATRIYYDPWRRTADGTPLNEHWREPDAQLARARLTTALEAGAGLLIYTGHASQFEWAQIGPNQEANLLFIDEPLDLRNGTRLPIVLAMTCMSSAFHTPTVRGTSLDEQWLLNPNGGAVAVWGPTGLGVSNGHDALQRGWLHALRTRPNQVSLGELSLAGYAELRASHSGAEERSALRTFALLGDPFTPARVQGMSQVLMPIIRR